MIVGVRGFHSPFAISFLAGKSHRSLTERVTFTFSIAVLGNRHVIFRAVSS